MLEPAQFQAFYQVMRSQIEHEDNLVTQRLSWFITSQSFLFTAYAILLNGPAGPPDPLRSNLMHLIPLLAILVCILILSTIAAGLLAMKNLRQHFRRIRRMHRRPAATRAGLPPDGADGAIAPGDPAGAVLARLGPGYSGTPSRPWSKSRARTRRNGQRGAANRIFQQHCHGHRAHAPRHRRHPSRHLARCCKIHITHGPTASICLLHTIDPHVDHHPPGRRCSRPINPGLPTATTNTSRALCARQGPSWQYGIA